MSTHQLLLDNLEPVLGTAAKILFGQGNILAASILTNAETSLDYESHDNWDGGQDFWKLNLGITTEAYLELMDRDNLQSIINSAIEIPLEFISKSDHINVKITTVLERNPDWRLRIRQQLSGEGTTNQGRVRSDNIAMKEHEGLRFRSQPEIFFYNAMKSMGIPFAPLSVVVQGGMKYRRIEPDFIIYKAGIVMVVEIDGDTYHNERPSEADARLKMLRDEGVNQEHIKASECDTPQKAREAVQRVIATMDKLKLAR